ncbi:signal peptidase I [Vibrio coralliilyticus]|uniref:signal peptidase I n=1 Tax=Vibrio coralliilyticus TaxID=190893 RepID=UPI0017E62600|nr:signal peptidase I [Vibrio coralliilyticus]NUW70843.1 signal peptidase I [Vibrio coralliilyticus]
MKIIKALINAVSLGLYDLIYDKKVYLYWITAISLILVLIRSDYLFNREVYIFTYLILISLFIILLFSPFYFKETFKKNTKIKKTIIASLHIFICFDILTYDSNVVLALNSGKSMYPTIDDDEVVLVGKLDESIQLKRDDIIAFLHDNKLLLKRIFALPKEKIIVNNNICNSEKCITYKDDGEIDDLTLVVPKDSYFVIGDNIENSKDSRYIDDIYIKKEDIIYIYLGKLQFL